MGYFDDIVPPDSASSDVATPPGVPRITVRPSPDQPDDMPGEVGLAPNPFEPWGTGEGPSGKVAPSPRTAGLFDDIVSPAARHKAAIERALSTTVPLRLQHPHVVEIASKLMADHGVPLDEALDRATMRLHAKEGTAEFGKIDDVIGKGAFDETQRAPTPPDLAQPAPGLGQGGTATEGQARPDGEHASGDSAPQGGDAAGEKTIGSEGASPTDNRAQSYGPAPRVAREGLSPPAPEPGLLSRLASPVTDIPDEIYQAGAESLGAANTYLNPWSEEYRKGLEADRDKWIGTGPGSQLGTGKGLLAAASIPFSPITGTFRSLIGHPLSVIMPTATPEQQEKMREAGVSEDMIPGQTREENYQKIKRKVDLAMMALPPRGPIPRAGPQPPARPPDTAAVQSDRMSSGARESGPFHSGARPAASQHTTSAPGAKSADDGSRAVNDTAGPPNKPTEPVPVYFDPNKHPQAAGHAKDAQNRGAPDVLTVARDGAPKRRQEALSGTEPQARLDRDEYPPAVTAEGGAGASVRLIGSSDNRGAGGSFGNQIKKLPDGTRIRVIIGPKPPASENFE